MKVTKENKDLALAKLDGIVYYSDTYGSFVTVLGGDLYKVEEDPLIREITFDQLVVAIEECKEQVKHNKVIQDSIQVIDDCKEAGYIN